MERLDGTIKSYNENGKLIITAEYKDTDKFVRCNYKTCTIVLNDSRTISSEQRKKIYALINEISDFAGEMPEYTKRLFKLKFISEQMKGLADDIFSLSDCDMTLAKDFITYLVDFVIEHDIPCSVPLRELCEDITRYVWACAKNKKCVVCGQRAELHHYDALGMGADRTEAIHEGLRAYPLCREHHTEAHALGCKAFDEKYILKPIVIDKQICKIYKLKTKREG